MNTRASLFTPLHHRKHDDYIAFLSAPLPCLGETYGALSAGEFVQHCQALAQQLPDGKHAINLCGNRYLFLVSFCAAILRKHINLLPPNKNIATQQKLISNYEDCYLLHDGGTDIAPNNTNLNISQLQLNSQLSSNEVPQIASDQLVAISFTSGSTGNSKPNLKYWQSLVTSSNINYTHMLPQTGEPLYQVATVPPQHMWGLETSIMLPLHHPICVQNSRPFYPADIITALEAMPEPRMLVTTPAHIRSLVGNHFNCPPLRLTLCATSPLSQALATAIEQEFQCELREVYGCSEVGSMAVRNTAQIDHWTLFKGIELLVENDQVTATGMHLAEKTLLQDKFDFLDAQHFTLKGRAEDMVDMAGKRGSLLEINQILQQFDGLVDGAIFIPPTTENTVQRAVTRLAAIVVLKPGYSKNDVRDFIRQHLDSAFVPRPIYVVPKIEREENGKLTKAKLHALYFKLTEQGQPA